MNTRRVMTTAIFATLLLHRGTLLAVTKCSADTVKVGSFCIDTYEASVWRIPNPLGANRGLVKKVEKGKATAGDLMAAGATQLGTTSDDYAPCTDDGQNCVNDIYAVSLPGVTPAAYITWFQAQQACSNGGKRLPSNAEWQQAVAGTPDGAPCNVSSGLVSSTGAVGCVSSYGAHDMVGNLYERVADWVDRSASCTDWTSQTGLPGGDYSCFGGSASSAGYQIPGAILRGGSFYHGTLAGPLAVDGSEQPGNSNDNFGFRCIR